MNADLASRLKKYVRPDQPFGPPDAADIKEPECAAALFDWNNQAFADLLTGSDVIVGRRGSGKSALLGTFRSKRYMQLSGEEARDYRDRFHLNAKTLLAVPDLIVEADTPAIMDEFEQHFLQRHVPSVEVIARLWNLRIWLLIGTTLSRKYPQLWSKAPTKLQEYVAHDDVVRTSVHSAIDGGGVALDPGDFIALMERFLISVGKRCVITFDNLERYKFDEVQNAVLGGLIAATGKMIGTQHPCIDVKLCLPSEIFDHLKTITFRADKDLQRIQYLHWTSFELMHLSARRLKVYFQLYDPSTSDLVRDLRLSDRAILRKFWHRYLPERIVNSLGIEEETFTYLLRHTQLLPRQVLTSLNSVARRCARDGRAPFTDSFEAVHIIRGIEDAEDSNAQAVLSMYTPMYPLVLEIFDLVMPRLRRIFDYGFLQQVYHTSARASMSAMGQHDFRSFWRLMLSTGAVGVVEPSCSSEIYETGRFEFNSHYVLRVSDKNQLCVHPMFSRIYGVDTESIPKVVLPRGSDFAIDER